MHAGRLCWPKLPDISHFSSALTRPTCYPEPHATFYSLFCESKGGKMSQLQPDDDHNQIFC